MSVVQDEPRAKLPKALGVGIIGCGLIGQKRADALGGGGNLIACADINLSHAEQLAQRFGAKAFSSWQELLEITQIDLVIVATLHDSLAEITLAAIAAGKHVLVEKPAARSADELVPVIAATKKNNIKSIIFKD